MTLGQAWMEALRGKAISRHAWNDASCRVVLVEEYADGDDDQPDYGETPARAFATRPLTAVDLRANDWFVIETLH
jgi:hypothetical protein